MNIKTKYSVNDEVWYVHPLTKKAAHGKIREIRATVQSATELKAGSRRDLIKTGNFIAKSAVIIYTIDSHIGMEGVQKRESELGDTKEQLINTIKSSADSL